MSSQPSSSNPDPEKHEPNCPQGSGISVDITDSRSPTLIEESESPNLTVAQIDSEISETITEPLQDYPVGYPKQAAFQSSDPSWSIYRAFGYLHSRVILELQDELRCMEEELTELDLMDLENGDGHRLRSRKDDRQQAKRENTESCRAKLIAAIRGKLVDYDEIVVKAHELNGFQRPSKRDYRSFRTWFWNVKPLNYEREEQFIKRKEDLITLRHGREWAGFDGWVEKCIQKLHCRLTHRIFSTPELRAKTNDEFMYYYSSTRIEKLVGIIITIIIFILLVLPVVAMYKLTTIGDRNSTFDAVGVLVVFTLLFSAAMSLLTKAKRHELFAASAAYCAVLVVFITNFGSDGPGGRS
ncbi:hypothetical protein K458DRAFT_418039 [Lentithecium fluviatile CBS 122367]|uniref:DUF6594 domain-containing protein n=1 Tax=Lentithecium fluviatile CBS 122367 TaxID=1168545 RepID=A0A6G1J2N1_9PLEO|nr:hypothetical protein K458DRAFT_418039 [Lentithecium fluviatile CBS 122367]